jgi:hypothetical protein
METETLSDQALAREDSLCRGTPLDQHPQPARTFACVITYGTLTENVNPSGIRAPNSLRASRRTTVERRVHFGRVKVFRAQN